MNRKLKYSIWGLALWFLLFLGWEWWRSYPKVRLRPVSVPENKDERIDSLLTESLSQFLIPGLAVGIIENEKVTYLKAFGFENLKSKDTMTLQSILPVASVSKLFTALSLANFALEYGISIDTTFNSMLPKGKKLPDEFNEISLRELLNHTSGISDSRSLSSIISNAEKRKLSNLPTNLPKPDPEKTEYHYADLNFDLIGYFLEISSKTPFDELILENTLSVGGMERSRFVTELPGESETAHGYKQTFLWKRIEPRLFKLDHYPSPSSGLVLNPEDLAKALLHLSRGPMGAFSEELAWLQNESETPAGFQKITLNNIDFIGHFGEQGGFSSLVIYSPDMETALFLVSNAEDKYDFRKQISSEILKLLNP